MHRSHLCNDGGNCCDITQSMARIVVNGKDLLFRSVSTSVWNQGPVNDLIVSTNQRVEEFFNLCGRKYQ